VQQQQRQSNQVLQLGFKYTWLQSWLIYWLLVISCCWLLFALIYHE
jgi:hypothetical protein